MLRMKVIRAPFDRVRVLLSQSTQLNVMEPPRFRHRAAAEPFRSPNALDLATTVGRGK